MYHNDKVENQFLYRTIGYPCGLLYMYKIDVIGVACCVLWKIGYGFGKGSVKKIEKNQNRSIDICSGRARECPHFFI